MNRLLAPLSVAILGCIGGCGTRTNSPPIAIGNSVPLNGVAEHITINNFSQTPLTNVRVVGIRTSDSTSGSVPAMPTFAPWKPIEIPWNSFGGWTPEPGDTIEVYADGFTDPVRSMIPTDEQVEVMGYPR